ncbi:hypothetical protein LIER_15884 [Lithospermum erythrorhizon]|uniref:Uncharacterized protein n=1 Tax=Lithospermum erythrorhizon TaxID=34254 RepID=A0AAV3Q6G6_LITER
MKSQIEDSDEVSYESIALMVKNFNRVFGKPNKWGYEEKGLNSVGRKRVVGGTTIVDGMQQPFRRIQVHEYEGYGHIQSECATFLKRGRHITTLGNSKVESATGKDDEEPKNDECWDWYSNRARQVPPGHDRSQTRLVYLELGQKNQ